MGRGAEGGFLGAEEGVGEVEGDCGRGGAGTDVDGGSFFFSISQSIQTDGAY